MNATLAHRAGIVAIGRNEGERLRRCLESALRQAPHVVYVDSGSTDNSVALAQSMGAAVMELDRAIPFTAARARNAGVARLCADQPDIEFVQVVDGDCEIAEQWLAHAVSALEQSPQVAVVCGRRRERYPVTVYNRLCDMEWDTQVGEAPFCGGDALIRLSAFKQIGGYDDLLIAGEEPEMCARLRLAGWQVQRIPHEMTLHDANMTRFSQWWRRAVRSGHAYAEIRARHGHTSLRMFVDEVRSIIEWGLILPLLALGMAWWTWGASLLLLGGYALLRHRVRRHRLERGDSASDAGLYATFCVLGKIPEAIGVLMYWLNRARGRPTALIEYKGNDQKRDNSVPLMPFSEVKT